MADQIPSQSSAVLDRPAERDRGLWHMSIDTPTYRKTLCGLVFDTPETAAAGASRTGRCHVCDDLFAAWLDDRWAP